MQGSVALTRKVSQVFALVLVGAPLALVFFAVFWNVNAILSERSYNPDTMAPPLEAVAVGKVLRTDRPAINFLAAKLEAFGKQGEFAAAVRSANKAEVAVWLDGLARWNPTLRNASVEPSSLLVEGASMVSRAKDTGNFTIAVPISDFRNVQVGTLVASVPATVLADINSAAVPAQPLTSSIASGRLPVVYAPALASEGTPVRSAATMTVLLLVLAVLTSVIIGRATLYVAAYVEALIGRAGTLVRRTIPVPVVLVDGSLVVDAGEEAGTLISIPQQPQATPDIPDAGTGRRAA